MHRSEAEGRFGAAEPGGRSSVCARALLFGVKFGGFGEGLIGRSQIMDKLQLRGRVTGDAIFGIIPFQ